MSHFKTYIFLRLTLLSKVIYQFCSNNNRPLQFVTFLQLFIRLFHTGIPILMQFSCTSSTHWKVLPLIRSITHISLYSYIYLLYPAYHFLSHRSCQLLTLVLSIIEFSVLWFTTTLPFDTYGFTSISFRIMVMIDAEAAEDFSVLKNIVLWGLYSSWEYEIDNFIFPWSRLTFMK